MNTPTLTETLSSPNPTVSTEATVPPEAAVPDTPHKLEVVVDASLGQVETLSEAEEAEFKACEAVIVAGWHTFVDVGLALARIRDARLYTGSNSTPSRIIAGPNGSTAGTTSIA
jgi:hypothetical protein